MTLDNFNNNCGKITAKPVLPSAPELFRDFLIGPVYVLAGFFWIFIGMTMRNIRSDLTNY